eukprot:2969076-Pyramimonas_sp.AAC.1
MVVWRRMRQERTTVEGHRACQVGLNTDIKPLFSRSTTGEFNSPPKYFRTPHVCVDPYCRGGRGKFGQVKTPKVGLSTDYRLRIELYSTHRGYSTIQESLNDHRLNIDSNVQESQELGARL